MKKSINKSKFNILDFKYKYEDLSKIYGSDKLMLFLRDYEEYLKLINILKNENKEIELLYNDLTSLTNIIKINNEKINNLLNNNNSLVIKYYLEKLNLYYTNYDNNLNLIIDNLNLKLEDNNRELENINRLKLF